MNQNEMERCYTPAEAAELLRCSREHVRGLIHSGKLEAFSIGAGKQRKHYVIPQYAIDDFIAAGVADEKLDRSIRPARSANTGPIIYQAMPSPAEAAKRRRPRPR